MTVDAHQHVAAGLSREHVVDILTVAVQAGLLRHGAIALLNLDRFVEVARGKRERVEEPIVGLGDPFAQRMMREMAVVARGDILVARLQP